MLRKQNMNPNRNDSFNNKFIQSKPHHSIATPDPTTSRLNYKPKFIKKAIHIQQDLIAQPLQSRTTPQESAHQSRATYAHSPTSITEHNTIDIDSFHVNKWKHLYQSTRQEMEARTQRFDKAINIFCLILQDMKQMIANSTISENDRLLLADERIDSLLGAFREFDCRR